MGMHARKCMRENACASSPHACMCAMTLNNHQNVCGNKHCVTNMSNSPENAMPMNDDEMMSLGSSFNLKFSSDEEGDEVSFSNA